MHKPSLLKRCVMLAVLACGPLASRPVDAQTVETNGIAGPARERFSKAESAGSDIGLGTRLLWYLPNRVVDLVDIVRLRLRLGPGLGANLRVSDYGSVYAGRYHSIYAGLPGPRYPQRVRLPIGREDLRGIVLGGVDATDDTLYGPRYAPTEVDVGAHLLVVGAEVGLDPVEMADFLAGFFFYDIGDDDYPRKPRDISPYSSGTSIGQGAAMARVDPKPARFASLDERLDYLHDNVPRRLHEPVRTVDEYFAVDPDQREVVPQTKLRLRFFTEMVQGDDFDLGLEPDFELDVELPNLKNKMRVFVETARENSLPGTDLGEREDNGVNIGARRMFEDAAISADAGVRVRWLPEAFARVSWRPDWWVGNWKITPEQRVYWESDDGFGELTSLRLQRWIGEHHGGVFQSTTAGKWTEKDEAYKWEQTLRLGRIRALLDEDKRGRNIGFDDTARAYGIRYSVFGTEGIVTEHRVQIGWRAPLYQKWIFYEVAPGVEWKEEDDFDIAYRLNIGVDILFWGGVSGATAAAR